MKIFKISKLSDWVNKAMVDEMSHIIENAIMQLTPKEKRQIISGEFYKEISSKNIDIDNINIYFSSIESIAGANIGDEIDIFINPKYFLFILDPSKRDSYFSLLKSTIAHELFHINDPKALIMEDPPVARDSSYFLNPKEFDAYSIEIIYLTENLYKNGFIDEIELREIISGNFSPLLANISENDDLMGVFSGSSMPLKKFLKYALKNSYHKEKLLKRLYSELSDYLQ